MIQVLGMIGAVTMPVWNIPLIVRIYRRKSSEDISIAWVTGVWFCVIAMLPSSMVSSDPVMRIFGIINAISFSFVFAVVLKYRKPKPAS